MAVITRTGDSVRSFKTALQRSFPAVSALDLDGAIAQALGFENHAALLVAIQNSNDFRIISFNRERFVRGLPKFPASEFVDVSVSNLILDSVAPPPKFLANINKLHILEGSAQTPVRDIYALRRGLAAMFGEIFELGVPESNIEDVNVARRFGRGVDPSNALPGWGWTVKSNSTIEFPGADH